MLERWPNIQFVIVSDPLSTEEGDFLEEAFRQRHSPISYVVAGASCELCSCGEEGDDLDHAPRRTGNFRYSVGVVLKPILGHHSLSMIFPFHTTGFRQTTEVRRLPLPIAFYPLRCKHQHVDRGSPECFYCSKQHACVFFWNSVVTRTVGWRSHV